MSTSMNGRAMTTLVWILQLVAAGILAQTLYFKFSGAVESRWIFGQLGVEPWGRYLAGAVEGVAVALLLLPSTAAVGAALGLAVITGAIGAHVFRLGISVQNDGGLLFGLALAVFVCCAGVAWIRRGQIPIVGPKLATLGAATAPMSARPA